MTDYSKLSDFEINCMIAKIFHTNFDQGSRSFINDGSVRLYGYDRGFDFNPCNNPADAWPIISDNRISIMYDQSTEKGNDAQWCLASSPCDQHIVDYVSPSKLLRAAMIVFLMMQEKKE